MTKNGNRQYVVTGAGGFIGRAIVRHLEASAANVLAPDRHKFDLADAATYPAHSFCNTIIVDCIAKIDGTGEERRSVNYDGLMSFIGYLNEQCPDQYRYVYFSTLSILDPALVAQNEYVNTKSMAEQLLRRQVKDYKIIRLSYPFGEGESSMRLISRLIKQIKNGEVLTLSNISVFLTPVQLLLDSMDMLLSLPQREINFLAGRAVTLEEIVLTIGDALGITPVYKVADGPLMHPPVTASFLEDYDTLQALKMFVNAQR